MAQLDNLNLKESEKAPINTDFVETNEILWHGDDVKRFNELVKDPDVCNAIQKVSDKCCIRTFWEDFKELEALDSAGELQPMIENLLVKYPGLNRCLAEAWLPIKNINFSSLNNQQKLNLLAFVKASSIKKANRLNWFKAPRSAEAIVHNNRILVQDYQKRLQEKLEQKNLRNFDVLEKTLKSDFWLTNDECAKFTEYLLLVKKHPEFIWIFKPDEAISKWWWALIGLISALAMFVWGVLFWVYAVPNIWKDDEIVEDWESITVYSEPEEITRLLTAQQWFTISKKRKVKAYATYSWPGSNLDLFNLARKFWNKVSYINIEMTLSGKRCLEFDLEGSTLKLDRDKKEIVLMVKKPNIFLRDEKTFVDWESWLIGSDTFIWEETKLREDMEDRVLNEMDNQRLLTFGIMAAESKILNVANMFNWWVLPNWENAFESCRIVFIDDTSIISPERR